MNSKFIILSLSFLLTHYQTNAQWYPQTIGSSWDLNGVCFIDTNIGWTVGEQGKIFKTTNGGTYWVEQSSETANYLSDVCFTDANNGWAVGKNGTIIKTTNGGTDWILQEIGTTYFFSVSFTDTNYGTVVGWNSTILRTIDGGQNWSSQSASGYGYLLSVCFTDQNNGTIVGSNVNAGIFRTTNGGQNWFNQSSGISSTLYDVSFSDVNYGMAVGEEGKILITTNGGEDWHLEEIGDTNQLFGISCVDSNISTTIGKDYVHNMAIIFNTTDGGLYWFSQTSGITQVLRQTSFADALNGWAVGDLGTVLHITNGGTTFIEEEGMESLKNFSLEQNFPNPFNPITSIQYAVSNRQFVTLKVYDLLGREIVTLVNEVKPAGEYEVEFNASNLPSRQGSALMSGIYFYQLKAGEFVETRKMVLLR
jgi:photosystem II stability/assembly factor-like uncharacterized protein